MAVLSTVKAHKQFKAYSLTKLVGILKSHESAVTKEMNVVSSMGSLALISKGKNATEEEDWDLTEYDLTSEDFALMVSNPKKFIKRRFPANKNRNWQGSYSAEKVKEEPKGVSPTKEPKQEAKIGGDLGFNCHYCGGKNHFAKDCMLRKQSEKNEEDDEEAKLVRRLEEIRKKKSGTTNTMNALIVQGNTVDDEFGGVEVWSTDSKDEKVRTPTHGRALLVKKENVAAKCLIVTSKSKLETNKNLISENSVEFARSLKDKTKALKTKVVVYQKVQTTPNQVYTVKGVTPHQTAELTALIEEYNVYGYDEFFWSAPIDNVDETKGLSQKTSWRVKGRYVAEPLNEPERFGVPSTSGAKISSGEPVMKSSETDSLKRETPTKKPRKRANIHKNPNTRRKEELREFQSLQDGGSVKYGNNSFGAIKGYGMITNGDFSIRKVAYDEGLQHNLVNVSQLVVGTRLKVSLDDDDS
ncbi:uncharacterized protein LOC128128385 [Lactuca sativa]|uniref:uncharacterized protein LOC128128385 n=1 Tax=Lactuca sativa TaxID=4236 RepID=UPI0022AFEB79|nr:uncharacterized protein LOC128128385 [Lactuca sativa]